MREFLSRCRLIAREFLTPPRRRPTRAGAPPAPHAPLTPLVPRDPREAERLAAESTRRANEAATLDLARWLRRILNERGYGAAEADLIPVVDDWLETRSPAFWYQIVHDPDAIFEALMCRLGPARKDGPS